MSQFVHSNFKVIIEFNVYHSVIVYQHLVKKDESRRIYITGVIIIIIIKLGQQHGFS